MFKYLIICLFLANASAFSYDYFQSTRERMKELDEDMDRMSNRMFQDDMRRLMTEESEIMRNATKQSRPCRTFGY